MKSKLVALEYLFEVKKSVEVHALEHVRKQDEEPHKLAYATYTDILDCIDNLIEEVFTNANNGKEE